MRRSLIAGWALLIPIAASAQFAEPELQIQKLSEVEYPSVAEDEPAVVSADEFYRLRSKASSTGELAIIRITFKGKWRRSAGDMAASLPIRKDPQEKHARPPSD
jgi:hypothetical protein